MDELQSLFKVNADHFASKNEAVRFDNRYVKPPKHKFHKFIKYAKAESLAAAIDFQANDRIYCLVDGSFIFVDFIEAMFRQHAILAKSMLITTLSMSSENIDSLQNLIKGDFIQRLDMIVSDYFFSHERNKLIKELYAKLDNHSNCEFQLSVAGVHSKICQFETAGGKKIVIHGSANLRSSDNIEQFVIEDSPDVYAFNESVFLPIIQRFKTIQKSIRGKELLWLQEDHAKALEETVQPHPDAHKHAKSAIGN